MATKKEKQLAIQLLKERIERLTGKKVMFKENEDYDDGEGDLIENIVFESFSQVEECINNNVFSLLLNKAGNAKEWYPQEVKKALNKLTDEIVDIWTQTTNKGTLGETNKSLKTK